jgi:branched-chain amino acid transport system permease protein
MTYLLHILILIGIYTIASSSLNLISGYAGLISIAHAAFYGIGAYVTALMALNIENNFFVNIALAIILAGILGALVGIPSLRTKDDYFILTTFGFQVIIYSILNNWESLTRGPLGLPGIPQPNVFGVVISNHFQFLILVFILTALTIIFLRRLVKSPFGRVLRAIREDEVFAQSLGKNTVKYKILTFVIGASLAGIAGSLYAYYITFVHPSSFTVMESIFMLSIVIVGGAGNLWGSVLGATLLITIPELLRFIGMPGVIAGNVRQILYGLLLLLFMMYRPRGILGEFAFRRR